MKNFKKLLLSIMLCLCFFLGACGKTPPPSNPSPDTQQGSGNQQNGGSQNNGSQNNGSQNENSQGGNSSEDSNSGENQGNENSGNNQGNENSGEDQGNQGSENEGGENNNEPTTPPAPEDPGLTETEKISAFASLNNLSSNQIYNTSVSNQTTTTVSQYYGTITDLSNSGMTQEQWETYVPQAGYITLNPVTKTVENTTVAGRNTQNEGYKTYTSYDYRYNAYAEKSSEIVKFNSDANTYNKYLLESRYGAWMYIVDEDYATNSYAYDWHNENYEITELIKAIANTEDYTNLNNAVIKSITDAMLDGKMDVDIEYINPSVQIDIIEENDHYALTINLEYNETTTGTPAYPARVYGEYKIAFNESGILTINAENGYTLFTDSYNYGMLELIFSNTDLNKEFTEEERVDFYLTKFYTLDIDFTGTFDETKLDADISICGGQAYPSKNIYDTKMIYVDLGITQTVNTTYGNTITANLVNNAEYTLYWDKECTERIEEGTTYTSYNRPIYVKCTPAEGYAIVKFLHRDKYGYSLEGAGSGRIGATSYKLSDNPVYMPSVAPLMDKIIKVVVDGQVVYDSTGTSTVLEGIPLTESKIYFVEIYNAYSYQ